MDFAVLLPPGWVRIPLDGRESARAEALATAKATEVPPQDRRAARQKIAQLIRESLKQARNARGTDILLSLGDYKGVPIPASCLVSYIEYGDLVNLDMLARELGQRGQGEVRIQKMAGQSAIRHHYTETIMTRTDFHTGVPGRTGLITFAFATPDSPLAGALTQLFDAIAETLRWQP